MTAWPWPLTFWPPGQCIPSDCHSLYVNPMFGVASSGRFYFRARTHTKTRSPMPLIALFTYWPPSRRHWTGLSRCRGIRATLRVMSIAPSAINKRRRRYVVANILTTVDVCRECLTPISLYTKPDDQCDKLETAVAPLLTTLEGPCRVFY